MSRNIYELTNQHISNIIWYNRFFYNKTDGHMDRLRNELHSRGSGIFPWRPLPKPGELEMLKQMNAIKDNVIIGNSNCSKSEGVPIGEISLPGEDSKVMRTRTRRLRKKSHNCNLYRYRYKIE